jgi:phage tail P2-like protein
MIDPETILPDSVAIFPHLQAVDLAIKKYLDGVKLETLLVYYIDQVDARALPILAKQFDVLGWKGWNLADTEQKRRDLLKHAIELHRYKGTPWAVKEALKSIGFIDVIITEHVNDHWARFSLNIDNEDVVITDSSFTQIIAMVEEYKNVRSVLDGIFLKFTTTDDAIIFADNDEASVEEEILIEDILIFSSAMFYDGVFNYDGSHDHSADADQVTIT